MYQNYWLAYKYFLDYETIFVMIMQTFIFSFGAQTISWSQPMYEVKGIMIIFKNGYFFYCLVVMKIIPYF